MNKIKLTREVRVGLMTVIAIFVLYFGLNFLKGIDVFSPIHYYYAQYSKIDGLVPSSPVLIKGYKVGQVEAIQYDFNVENSFIVKISVVKNINLPKGTQMELFDDGLLGGKAVQLIFPQGGAVTHHQNGDTLTATIANGLMQQLTGDLMPKIESIAEQADSLIRSVRLMVNGDALQNSLRSIESATADLAVTSASLKKVMQKDLPGILTNVNSITSDFAVISNQLKTIDFAQTIAEVDVTIKDLRQVSRKINEGEGSLGLLLNDRSLYDNLSNTANSADELLIDLRNHPKRYVHFSLFGSKK